MKQFLFFLVILILLFACKNNIKDNISLVDTNEISSQSIFKSDSINIELRKDSINSFMILSYGDFKREFNLSKLNIPFKTPINVSWINNHYACIMTWWSQSQSRYVFVPTKPYNEFIYIDKDIEETDSINNNILYIDSVYDAFNKVVFKAENLLTRKSVSLEVLINDTNGIYPYYEKIEMTRHKVTVQIKNEIRSVDITAINSEL